MNTRVDVVRQFVFLIAIAVAAAGCSDATAVSGPDLVHLRFATGPVGGGFYAFGEALTEALNQRTPALRIERPSSGGVVSNVEAIEQGTADIGFAFADVAYLATNGQLSQASRPFLHLRGIAVVQLTPVQLVAAPEAKVRSVYDLRGRRVAVGPEGSGTALTARLVLGAFGLRLSDVTQESMDFREAGRRVAEGTLDAMFDNAQYAESVAAALHRGAQLVPITGVEVIRLRQEYPFLREMILPAGTYHGSPSVRTVGVESLLVCRSDLSDEVVHAFTSSLFEALSDLSRSGRWNLMDLASAPATSVRLHGGAAQYYREQELLR